MNLTVNCPNCGRPRPADLLVPCPHCGARTATPSVPNTPAQPGATPSVIPPSYGPPSGTPLPGSPPPQVPSSGYPSPYGPPAGYSPLPPVPSYGPPSGYSAPPSPPLYGPPANYSPPPPVAYVPVAVPIYHQVVTPVAVHPALPPPPALRTSWVRIAATAVPLLIMTFVVALIFQAIEQAAAGSATLMQQWWNGILHFGVSYPIPIIANALYYFAFGFTPQDRPALATGYASLLLIQAVTLIPIAVGASYWYAIYRLQWKGPSSTWWLTFGLTLRLFFVGIILLGGISYLWNALFEDGASFYHSPFWSLAMLASYPLLCLTLVIASLGCCALGLLLASGYAIRPAKSGAYRALPTQPVMLVAVLAAVMQSIFYLVLQQTLMAQMPTSWQWVPLAGTLLALSVAIGLAWPSIAWNQP